MPGMKLRLLFEQIDKSRGLPRRRRWHCAPLLLLLSLGVWQAAAGAEGPKFPDGEVEGVGTHEAPRGTLSHWVVVKNGRLANYQAVVPTTWNASPRDGQGHPGPYESSLLGNPVIDAEKPLEILRTVHSFDPCMACACHTFDPSGKPIATVKVL